MEGTGNHRRERGCGRDHLRREGEGREKEGDRRETTRGRRERLGKSLGPTELPGKGEARKEEERDGEGEGGPR